MISSDMESVAKYVLECFTDLQKKSSGLPQLTHPHVSRDQMGRRSGGRDEGMTERLSETNTKN